ncbi:hypothetical protein QOZ80_9AG0689890 [Eleusine coracana subsp. coracana]|nr:hypothetical protein QOZ80_9AG0689890 [Eleusine coracana subsp. coracana]
MIQPMYIGSYNIDIDGCCVHDMVLDFIRSLSSEENFVTVFTDMDKRSTQTKIRRLSLQHGNVDHGSTWYTERIAQVRSVLVFSSAVDITPALQNFKILRVLDLQDCVISNGYNLKHLCNLFHLRYLNLKETKIDLFPEEVIGNLQFLETLDLRCSVFSCLPLTVTQLKYLMCLRVYVYTRVPDEIGSLRSLEELSWLNIHEDSSGIVEALGFLTQLRVLNVALFTYKWNDKLLESLHKLQKIQDFEISDNCWTRSDPVNIDGLDTWMAPPHLRSLHIQHWSWFSTLPTWINNNPPHNLSILSIAVKELRQENLVILGELPSLRNLDLLVDHVNLRIYGNFVVGAGSFPCLLCCRLFGFVAPVVLQQGAMPLLRTLQFGVKVREARKIAGSSGSFDFSLGNLSSLQNVYVFFSI